VPSSLASQFCIELGGAQKHVFVRAWFRRILKTACVSLFFAKTGSENALLRSACKNSPSSFLAPRVCSVSYCDWGVCKHDCRILSLIRALFYEELQRKNCMAQKILARRFGAPISCLLWYYDGRCVRNTRSWESYTLCSRFAKDSSAESARFGWFQPVP